MANQSKVGRHATTVATDNGKTRVVYHSTVVVEFDHVFVKLNSGGWRTQTTKNRMNQASNQFGLGYNVFQKNFDWFVKTTAGVYPFVDGCCIGRQSMAVYENDGEA